MVELIGVHRTYDRDVVGYFRQMRQHLRQFGAALPMTLELVARPQIVNCSATRAILRPPYVTAESGVVAIPTVPERSKSACGFDCEPNVLRQVT